MSPTLLYVAGGLMFALGTALLGAREGAGAKVGVMAAEGSAAGGQRGLVARFWRALAVLVPLAVVTGLMVWFICSPHFNPPRGAIRW